MAPALSFYMKFVCSEIERLLTWHDPCELMRPKYVRQLMQEEEHKSCKCLSVMSPEGGPEQMKLQVA